MAFQTYTYTADTDFSNAPQLQIKSGASFIPVGDIVSMAPPVGFETNVVEVTHLASPNGTREFAPGRPNPVTLTATIGYSLGSPGFQAIQNAKGTTTEFKVVYSGSAVEHSFSAIVMSFQPSEVSVDGGRWQGTLTLQLTTEVSEN